MIPELGHFALALALGIALVQAVAPMVGASLGRERWMAMAAPAALAQFACVGFAFLALTWAFVTSDFSVSNVAQNSHSLKPMLYKVSGVWGNHEGSMLLWVLILTLFGAAVARFGANLPLSLKARVLSVQAMIGAAFHAFILFTSNPFTRVTPVPLDGNDLNPLLQDPGLAFHPPFLYLGYVGFSIAFCFAVAALIEGRVDAAWARWVRPWTLAAWTSLTFGIAMGSWWAYYELGWGGWWYWDPVENASFMPWLAGGALLHSAVVVEKRDALKSWTILLAILTFSLSLMGTFLVRSGVLTSVHAFATDPERGVFILAILVVAIGGSLALYAWRAPGLRTGGLFAPISREGALVLNNVLLTVACGVVLVGTLYPLLLEAAGGGKISVGPPFFNAAFTPIIIPLLIATPFGPLLAWKRGDLAGAAQRLFLAAAAAGAAAIATLMWREGASLLAAFGMALGAWLVIGALVEFAERIKLFRAAPVSSWNRAAGLPRAAWGMTLAHAGAGVVVAGVTGISAWKLEDIRVMGPGDRAEIAGFEVEFFGARGVEGPNYRADRGVFMARREGRDVASLFPEKRFYPVQQRGTTEAAIHTLWSADLYVVLGEPQGGGRWTVRLYHNPTVPWIWLGSVIVVIGGLVSLTDRRHRVGAPVRAKRARGPAKQAPA